MRVSDGQVVNLRLNARWLQWRVERSHTGRLYERAEDVICCEYGDQRYTDVIAQGKVWHYF